MGFLSRRAHLRRASRGASTVIGAIFYVVIALFITTNIFMWSISKHSEYDMAVVEMNQRDAEKVDEQIRAVGNFTVFPSNSSVRAVANITCYGPSAQLTTMWVVDSTKGTYAYKSGVLCNLRSGDSKTITVSATFKRAIGSGDDYEIWFVTGRGNTVDLESPIVPVARLAEEATFSTMTYALGDIVVEHGSLEWSTNGVVWHSSYEKVTGNAQVRWRVTATNHGPQYIDVTTDSVLIGLGGTGGAAAKSAVWSVSTTYRLDVDVSRSIEFATASTPNYIGTYTVIITLVGSRADGSSYGQSVPFELFIVE